MPRNHQIWPEFGNSDHCWLIRCPVDGLAGGCGARAVSRKTPIYFMTYCPTTTLLFSLIFIGQTRGLGGGAVHLHSAGQCTFFKFSVTNQDWHCFSPVLHLFVPPPQTSYLTVIFLATTIFITSIATTKTIINALCTFPWQ